MKLKNKLCLICLIAYALDLIIITPIALFVFGFVEATPINNVGFRLYGFGWSFIMMGFVSFVLLSIFSFLDWLIERKRFKKLKIKYLPMYGLTASWVLLMVYTIAHNINLIVLRAFG